MPGWTNGQMTILAAMVLIGAGFLLVCLVAWLRSRAKRVRRRERNLQNIAYSRAWDWIYGRKHRRLTYVDPLKQKIDEGLGR